jgi:hypothetical protein
LIRFKPVLSITSAKASVSVLAVLSLPRLISLDAADAAVDADGGQIQIAHPADLQGVNARTTIHHVLAAATDQGVVAQAADESLIGGSLVLNPEAGDGFRGPVNMRTGGGVHYIFCAPSHGSVLYLTMPMGELSSDSPS